MFRFLRAAYKAGKMREPVAIRPRDLACRINSLGMSIDRAGYVKSSGCPVSLSQKTVGMTVHVTVISCDLACGIYCSWVRIDRPWCVERRESALCLP